MDELTLGLVGAGVVVVAGMAAYNALQAAKVRRKMPRSMPSETADTLARQERDDDAPFIEPVRQPSARRDAAPAAPEAAVAAAPASAAAPAPAGDRCARVEPTFGSAPDTALPADLQADETLTAAPGGAEAADTPVEPHAEDAPAPQPGEAGTVDAHDEPSFAADDAEPVLPAATTISSAPPAIVDRRIDCIVPIRLGGPMPGERLMPAAQRLRRAGSKPVHIEGKPEGSDHWELLQGGVRYYEELRAAAQLANRNGPLNELEFSEFVSGVGQFADAIDGGAEFPDMLETVQMARELDGFAAQCDAQLSINVMSDGAPWSANYVQAVASQDGLLLSRDGTRFVKLDAKQNPVFMLQFGDTNFLRDDLTYKGGNMITLVLDVPVADEDILPFKLMCDYAKSLSDRIGARVVDDSRRPLPEATLVAIEQQLMKLYGRLEQAGIPAGSPVTRRLFSQ
ncbi:MAG: Cell division protein ZipA [Burkholderia gladioli]|nr:MAG: Cell division protein ZipA [Burkholderia gladioli]